MFGQNWPTQQSHGLFATAKVPNIIQIVRIGSSKVTEGASSPEGVCTERCCEIALGRLLTCSERPSPISPMSLSHATWMKGLSTCMRPTWWFIASHMVHRRSVALYERALTSLSTIRTAVRPRVLPTDGLSERRRWRLLISQSQCFNKYLNYMQQTLRRGYWIGSQVLSTFPPVAYHISFPFSVSLLPFLTFQFNSIPV